jgi:hypothetical protein
MPFIVEIEKSTLKFIWKYIRLKKVAKAILSKKSNTGGTTISDFQLQYKAIVRKTACYWPNNQYRDKCNIIENPDMNPCSYAHLNIAKGTENI